MKESAGRAARAARSADRSIIAVCLAIAGLIGVAPGLGAQSLATRRVSSTAQVPSALIVGRARCDGHTWLLLESAVLVSIGNRGDVTVRPLTGTRPTDHPWGLACADGTLWTMASPRQVGRISFAAEMGNRQDVILPRVALFGFRNHLIFQSLPIAAGAPALSSQPAAGANQVRTWPALSARSAATREQEVADNLVACGLAASDAIPCWFAGGFELALSDGLRVMRADVKPLAPRDVSRTTPVWDVAAAPDRLWVLFARSRDGATRLVASGPSGSSGPAIDLPLAARIIVESAASRCVLLMTDGTLAEVILK